MCAESVKSDGLLTVWRAATALAAVPKAIKASAAHADARQACRESGGVNNS